MIHVAIIGSGPSGCYIADALAKKLSDSQVDIFDKLPTPFGLVRSGVAPDHLHTKNITRQFERILSKENIRFIGNVNIGEDISYSVLKQHYHVVVIASGASVDRKLNINGELLNGVYGAGEFSRWYNSHPESVDLNPHLSNAIAIIGNGNVALDIVRILSGQRELLNDSDITQPVMRHIEASTINDIYLIGRRSIADASFTSAELKEVLSLTTVAAQIDLTQIPDQLPAYIGNEQRRNADKNLALFRSIDSSQSGSKDNQTRLHFIFCASPIEIIGKNTHVTQIQLVKNHFNGTQVIATDEQLTLNVGTVISAIGFKSAPITEIPFEEQKGTFLHDQGKIESGVYTTGWCKRGANGVIPVNRVDAINTAKTIIADWEQTVSPPKKTGFEGISVLLDKRNIKTVSYNDWKIIDQVERDRAADGKPREKFTTVAEMLALF